MRVIVTGGSGLIGRALVESLIAHEHRAVIVSRNPDRLTGLPDGVEAERWDAADAARFAEIATGADAIVHLAGESIASGRWTAERKRRIRDSRVRATTAVASALGQVENGPRVLLQGSAVGFYGPRGDEVVDEGAMPGSDFLAEVCRDWEAASAAVEERGVRRAILRTGVVLARDGGALPRMALPFKLFGGGPVGSGDQWLPWIHLADEVEAIRLLLESSQAAGPFNLTAPEPVTNRELAKALGRALGRPSFVPTPGFVLKLALGEMSTIVLDGQRAVPRALLDLGYAFRFERIADALADIYD